METLVSHSRDFLMLEIPMAPGLTPTNSLGARLLDSLGLSAVEIAAFDPASKRFFVTGAGTGLAIIDAADPTDLRLVSTLDLSTGAFGNFGNGVNSVAVGNGVIAVAVAAAVPTDPGKVFLIDSNGALLKTFEVGSLPDMLTFTPDGKKLLVAIEGERSLATVAAASAVDPAGGVAIIDMSNGAASATMTTADFTGFDGQEAALRAKGVRVFNGKAASVDLEPEYIAVSPDSKTALVTLQEANAVAVLNLNTGKFSAVTPLGLKRWEGLSVDFSDRDSSGGTGYVPLTTSKVFGMYMPDAIASFSSGGKTFYVTANEGDDRDDFLSTAEKIRIGSATLDAAAFPDSATLKSNAVLGRLSTPNPAVVGEDVSGDTDGDGDVDVLLTYGARSFSILDSKGKVVFDSADHIERFIATTGVFTSTGTVGAGGGFDDTRSDDKGPEPEGVTVGVVGDRTLAFVGLERGGGGVLVYDVTDVKNVQFVSYVRNASDISPEGLVFVAADRSPSGQSLLAVSNEVSNTLSVFGLTRIANGTGGNDTIKALVGVDEMTGGAGKDRFVFSASSHIGVTDGVRDVITDFTSGSDIVDLRTIDANTTASGNQAFKFASAFSGRAGQLLLVSSGGDTLVQGDVDGDGDADFIIELAGVASVESSDFLL